MFGESGTSRTGEVHRYYKCATAKKHKGCKKKTVRKQWLEDDVCDKIAVYVKLPGSFFISTPVGKYNPDWAIAFHEGTVKHIYFIAETKGTTLLDRNELRGVEDLKIQCAKAHFAAISNDSVVYDVVDSYDKLMQVVME